MFINSFALIFSESMGFKVDSKIKRAIERDKKFMITTTKEDFPLVVQRASGDYIYDISGNRFIDFSLMH